MSQIKIIGIPPGEAPLDIRREWVGLSFPVVGDEARDMPAYGVITGTPIKTDGYVVETSVALNELKKKSPLAAAWWKANPYQTPGSCLIFDSWVCEVSA